MTKLKSCPFCGGEAKMVCDVTCGYELFRVFCTNCRAQANYGWLEAEAVELWNTRAERTTTMTTDADSQNWYSCDSCDADGYAATIPNFCPNCGAKVVER